MTQIESFTRRLLGILFALGLTVVVMAQATEPVQPRAAQAGPTESSEVEADAETDAPQHQGPGVPERLRHKDRAITAGTANAVTARAQPPASSSTVQHNESDMEFVRESAGTKSLPQHTPEWTNPKSGDPGRSQSAEKNGTTDINIGVGENQAAGGGKKDDQ